MQTSKPDDRASDRTIYEWMERAADNSRRQGKRDSELLWRDGLAALKAKDADIAALREALVLADGAMNHMGDVLNAIDAVSDEDVAATTPAFEAVAAALSRTA